MNLSLCDNSSSVGMEYARCLEEAEEDIAYSICPDLALCNTSHSGDNVGLAFGLTIGAGLATTLGALLPFIPCIKLTNTRILSAGLAVAAGVMIYVSFAEIWKKSRDNFCCVTPEHFDTAVTACFFGGILITVLLDLVVGGLQRLECGVCCCCCPTQRKRGVACLLFCCKQRNGKGTISATNRVVERAGDNASQNGVIAMTHLDATTVAPSDADTALSLGGDEGQCQSNTDSSGERQSCDGLAITDGASVAGSENTNHYATVSINDLFSNSSLLRMNAVINEPTSLSLAEVGEEKEGGDSTLAVGGRGCASPCIERVSADSSQVLGPAELKEITEILGKNTKQLHRMGILTGLAIAIHNFPEGLATFVAALSSPSLGVALAVAIALHNVPEGLCVAMPVYYATGSRLKGFLWAFLSGISEPFGALLGWLVLQRIFGPLVYGITFGFIAGMMVFISLKELLPTAYRFDKTGGKLVSTCLVLGMLIMAASLLLFLY